jgi:hypothetical protein
LQMLMIPVLLKHNSSMNKTFALNIGVSASWCKMHWQNTCPTGVLCDTDSYTVWTWYRYNFCSCNIYSTEPWGKCTTCKTSGSDGRLSFNNSEDLYIMYRMQTAHCIQWNVPVSWSQWLTEREVQWSGTLQLGYFFFVSSNSICSISYALS